VQGVSRREGEFHPRFIRPDGQSYYKPRNGNVSHGTADALASEKNVNRGMGGNLHGVEGVKARTFERTPGRIQDPIILTFSLR
jgi:hypothetical protein